jgi:hypothetical protein
MTQEACVDCASLTVALELASRDGRDVNTVARTAIEDYIDQRDTLWHELSYRAGPISPEEIEHLCARNEFVEAILKTKVAAKLFLPEHLGLEKLRINVCNAFVQRVRLEIRGNDTRPKIDFRSFAVVEPEPSQISN